jgi:hypothetical protein
MAKTKASKKQKQAKAKQGRGRSPKTSNAIRELKAELKQGERVRMMLPFSPGPGG